MRVLVTGGKGFVGRAIVQALSGCDIETVILDKPPAPNGLSSEAFWGADITNTAEIDAISELGDIDTVIHSAGLAHQFGQVTKEKFWEVNVEGTANIARLAVRLHARRFILISSVSVYGKVKPGQSNRSEVSDCEPEGFYAQSKYESESAAGGICEKSGIDLTVLRLATVIGEGDGGNVSRLIKAIDRKRFYWIGKGENRKSLVYKEDVARACLSVLTSERYGGGTYNVSAPAEPMKNIVSFIERALGKKVLPLRIPARALKLVFGINSRSLGIGRVTRLSETVEKWLSDETVTSERFKADYGFEPETGIEEAISREVDWYLANK